MKIKKLGILTFTREIENLINSRSIPQEFGRALNEIIADHMIGRNLGRSLPTTFLPLIDKHTDDGVLKIERSVYQVIIMVKDTANGSKFKWKIILLPGKKYLVKELSSLI